ncbi:MAG: M48 family metallopeptidase [Myxococcales bacterium]|nr:M48 family metallopeptidase [Myxococcales bacterium]MCB9533410.1 M48 family metallopeptidase [Myxococcales bacterium]
MNFFEHQDNARGRTRRLLGLFALALLGLVVAFYAVLVVLGNMTVLKDAASGTARVSLWRPELLATSAFFTTVVVGASAFFKTMSLGGTGADIALGVGARPVNAHTTSPAERRLLNVVEEMAIASGVPVPDVFILDNERGINAFAAGYEPGDAAIAVTAGTLATLNRDELQGVVAHEFSHILNGDMRLNVRLIGILYGIMMIGNTGGWILRGAFNGVGASRRRDGGATAAIIAFGLSLWGIGSLGLLAGRLIQRAVSRQREFLADASAVQFTRNTNGLVSALKKIGGHTHGARIDSTAAGELSHMFFGESLPAMFGGAFATHPPLADRIRRLEPTFDGAFVRVDPAASLTGTHVDGDDALELGTSNLVPSSGAPNTARAGAAGKLSLAGPLAEQAGRVSPDQVDRARDILATIPGELRAAAAAPLGAVALVYSVVLDPLEANASRQLDVLAPLTHPIILNEVRRLQAPARELSDAARLPALSLAAPALRQLAPRQIDQLFGELNALVSEDDQMTVFEFAAVRSLHTWLDPIREPNKATAVQFYAMRALAGDAATILSAIARYGHDSDFTAAAAFERGVRSIPMVEHDKLPFLPPDACDFGSVDHALRRFRLATPILKQRLINAMGVTAAADGVLSVREAELLRVTSEAIGCPLPPFLPTTPDAAIATRSAA